MTVFAQPSQYTPMTAQGYQFKRILCDSTLHLPSFCGVPNLRNSTAKNGALAMDTCNNRLYKWTRAAGWSIVGGTTIDTTSLSNRIDARVKYTDTAAMLQPYLLSIDTTDKWVVNVEQIDDTTIRVYKGTTSTDITIHAGGGSGTTPDLQAVTTAGATTDQTVTMTQYSGLFQNEYNKTELVGGIVNYYPFYSQYQTINHLIYIRGSELNTSSSNHEYEYFNGITNSDHVKINPNVIELAGGGGSTVQIIPTFGQPDAHYLPISDAATDTLATLADVRAGGGSGFVPYTGATQDVDLGTNKISAHSVYVTGTNGNGHVHLKHQASDATATGQSTSLFADSNGDIKWKNDGNYYTTLKTSTNTADAVYTFPSATTTLIGAADTSAFQRKNIAAYSFKANNTNAAANVTDQAFRDTAGTYSSTITWTGTTAPSGTANHSFRFTRIGKQVTANIHLNYGTAGSTLTAVQMALPASFPTPAEPTGLGAASDMLYPAVGYLNTGNTVPSSTPRAALRVNPADNGWELYIVGGAGNYKTAWISVTYYTN